MGSSTFALVATTAHRSLQAEAVEDGAKGVAWMAQVGGKCFLL
jgi:hypothetical protein